ncbi:hypothetical protein BJY17_003032 [Agromyces hippuratus]|uniref:Alpha-L-rhamnosidase n=1 Tax=Agromyces hippuratus TaxID=286438 RepID=A0A852X8S0_9MICO|nr:glycosyl hydrolase [Agromyces hippuratus]NYG22285.1 hypothetical protein [Agromyces hippuratus]
MATFNDLSLSRRQLLGYSAAAAAGVLVANAAPQSAGAAVGSVLPAGTGNAFGISEFADPGTSVAPKFRWWWPNGQVEVDEIVREVDQVADAGFGGLEIADVHHSVASGDLDVDGFPWGGDRWCEAVEAALAQAKRRDIRLDITLGPSWPAAVPTITPQHEAALTELVHGVVELAPGQAHRGAVPAPAIGAEHGVTETLLLSVQAFEIVTKPAKGNIVLKRASGVDLTDAVVDGAVDWTAPAGTASWVLLAFWRRGSGQLAEGGAHTNPTSYVVDHFSSAGAQAVIDFWESEIISARMSKLLSEAGGAFFEDSLEIETEATIWTRRLPEEFRARQGYELTPFLPVVIELKEKYLYDFDDIVTTRVRDDFNQVLSDLYSEHHLVPFRDWAHSHGLEYRVQAYGLEQDSIDQAGIVDIPETESLGAKNVDDYRVLASGRDIAGHTILSCESAAYLGKSYSATITEVLTTHGEMFAGGVNQSVLHGFPYASAPGAGWPGFAAFSPYYNNSVGYSEAWGPRMPVWAHLPDVAAYLARTQWVLRAGRPRYDLVFLRQKGWAQTGIGAPWATASGIPVGWTHGFLTGSSLEREGAVLAGGRLAPEGGAYKAVIVDIDRFRGNEATLTVATAERLLDFADAGLPIVLFGDWSKPAAIGFRSAEQNARVAEVVAALRNSPSVALAPANADIPIALASLGVAPDVDHETSNLKHIRRVDGGVDYYYLVNAKHNPAKDKLVPIDHDVVLTAEHADSVPYELDAWSGEVRPLVAYRRDGARVTVRVRLQPAQSTVIVLAPRDWAGRQAPSEQVVETDAVAVRAAKRGVELVTDAPGRFSVRFADGRTATATVKALPAPIELTSWTLSVEDWQPGASPTETAKPVVEVPLSGLVPWSAIPGLADTSGIGRYTTRVKLGSDWKTSGAGIRLELGRVVDTFRVRVNGKLVEDRDLTDSTVDISEFAHPGNNTIEVEVASTLINRLRVVNPTVYGVVKRADYGLLGPVVIRPYGVAEVR